MSYTHLLRNHLETLGKSTYVTADSHVDHLSGNKVIDCSFGVSPFGYSNNIDKQAIIKSTDMSNYPPFPYNELKDAIIHYWKETHRLTRSNIHVCAGTMLILTYLNVLFLERGDRVLGYTPQFPEYIRSVRIHGGLYDAVPLQAANKYTFNADMMIQQMKEKRYKLVYLDNPNNPTGQIIPIDEIEAVVYEAEKQGICVIVDEAYGEYMSKGNSAITLLDTYSNLYVTRSFSKGYALASIRIGYVVAGDELSSFYSIVDDLLLNPFGLEAAIISLEDEQFLRRTTSKTKRIKCALLHGITKLEIFCTDETVPIFMIKHPDETVNLQALLRSYGVLATSGFGGVGQNSVRIRIPAQADPLLQAVQRLERAL